MSKLIVAVAICGALPLCAVFPISGANAETMADPTRPPGAQGGVQGDDSTVNTGPVLQSILVGAGRKEAIISGRVVKVGDQIGEALVVKIMDAEVVLRNDNELQTLKLFPTIEKRLTASHGGIRAGLHGQQK